MAIETGRDYTRFLFDDILAGLILSLREELPQFTETDQHEPLNQFARMVSFVGHRDASMIDLTASELSWPTLQRRSSAVASAALVGQALLPDSPSSVDVLLDLTGEPGPADIVLVDQALLRTSGDAETAAVIFESQAGDVTVGNLEFTTIAEDAGAFSAAVVQTQATPWTGPVVGDALYYGHAELTFDGLKLTGAGSPANYSTVLEYYDGRFRQVRPDDASITVLTAGLSMTVNDLIGFTTSMGGLTVRVTHNDTQVYQDVVVSSPNTLITVGFLGQSSPSTDPNDYTVSALWLPVPDDTLLFTPSGTTYERELTYLNPSDIPASGLAAGRKWQLATVNGTEAYWLRERVYSVGGGPVGPTQIDAEVNLSQTWTLQVNGLQGQTVEDIIGRTTGAAFEEFTLSEAPYVGGSFSELDAAGDTDWSLVDGLLSADPDDKVFILLEDPDASRFISFGDGTNGRIPPAGSLLTATYRINADENGNVGVNTVTNVEAGANFLSNARNPREATGWKEKEGATTASLARVRRLVPAGVRTSRNVAVTSEDVEYLSTQVFTTSDGRSPFQRVAPVEQGAGFKTLLAVCVGAGDQVPALADVEELQDYYNGSKVGFQRFDGTALANQEVIATAYTPLDITVTATLSVARRYAPAARSKADAALRAATSALSATSDGIFRHTPGGLITLAFYLSILGLAEIDGLVDVLLVTSPSLPITLAKTGLPRLLGDPSITITEV